MSRKKMQLQAGYLFEGGMENRKGMTPLGPEGYKKGLEHWTYRLARGWERLGKGGGVR